MGNRATDEAFSPTLTEIAGPQGRSASPRVGACTTGLSFNKAWQQIAGARDFQEDAYLIVGLPGTSGGLVLVADGMGGYEGGHIAGNVAIQAF